jgi:hypothetical protein
LIRAITDAAKTEFTKSLILRLFRLASEAKAAIAQEAISQALSVTQPSAGKISRRVAKVLGRRAVEFFLREIHSKSQPSKQAESNWQITRSEAIGSLSVSGSTIPINRIERQIWQQKIGSIC